MSSPVYISDKNPVIIEDPYVIFYDQIPISLDWSNTAQSAYYIVNSTESSIQLARYYYNPLLIKVTLLNRSSAIYIQKQANGEWVETNLPVDFNPLDLPTLITQTISANSFIVYWSQIVGKPTFSQVAFSGLYSDLISKPSIPAQVNLIAGDNIIITGVYPNLTINGQSGSGINLTTTGSSGAATLVGNTLNIPVYSSGGSAVSSVFGRTGIIVATSGDYTTDQVTEGTNKYYTDTRVIGAPLTGYISGAGTISASDSILSAIQKLNGNIEGLPGGGVSSFNTRTGDVTLTSSDVTTALTFTPYNDTNPDGYITGNQAITLSGDISGTGTTAITTVIGASKVTNTMLAGSIAASKLIGTDITTLGTIITGTWNGTAIGDTYISSASTWNAKANTASPTFTGTVILPSTTSIGSVTSTEIGYLSGVTSAIQTQLTAKAPLASPTFTGTPVAPTASGGTNTTQIATTAFVQSAVTSLVTGVSSVTNSDSTLTISPTTGSVVASLNLAHANTWLAQQILNSDNLTTTLTRFLSLTNNTAATSGVQSQISPGLSFLSHGWTSGGADQSVETILYGSYLSGTNITPKFNFGYALNGTIQASPYFAIEYFSGITDLIGTSNLDLLVGGTRYLELRSASGGQIHFPTTAPVNIGTGTSIASAVLQVVSTTKGFLPPVMTTTQQNAISSPATGLIIYDSTLDLIGIRTSAAWRNLAFLDSPTFTGTVVLPSTTSIGTTTSTELGYVHGVTSAIQTQLDSKAALASPTFTGTPSLPTGTTGTTQSASDNSTKLATTAYADRVATYARRIGTTASSSTPTPDSSANDQYNVTALAANATFGAPTGTPTDGQSLIIRIKDNGTARTLAWNAIYRASTDFALPTTTVISKTIYVQFVYNAADSKWDAVGLTQGF